MRRTAVAVTGFGCVIGVFAAGGLSPASASAAGRGLASSHVSRAGSSAIETKSKPSTPGPSATSATAASGMQTVTYDGYSVTVPASWQVFHLDSDPGQCVRYDINAVYLGSPGANQNCPSNLMGRAETITITPAGVSGSSSQARGGEQSAAAQGGLAQSPPPSEAGRAISARASSFSRMSEFSQESELRGTVTGNNLSVTATYGSDPAPVTRYLSSLHRDQPQRAASPSGPAAPVKSRAATTKVPAPVKSPAATTKAPAPVKSPVSTKSTPGTSSTAKSPGNGKPSNTLASTLAPSIPAKPLNGFDTCTAPSLSAMKAWKAKYSAIGIYIGGQNMACDYGNLSASWVKSAHALGWSLLPLYVGLQAPCNSFADISTTKTVAQGTQAANTAVGDAANLGLGKGSPVYYDMEAYNNANSSCRNTVLQFLDAWTAQVHARGYISGVYSSAASGVSDLVAAGSVNGHLMNKPDAMWFALWDKKSNLTGTPYLPASKWASDRVKQFQGNENVKVGGYTLNIDADRVGGAVSAP
jgi:hypothetical protein